MADNNWTINESAPKEPDHEGNVNNFFTPADIVKNNPIAAILDTVAPGATTTKMAGEQPLEKDLAPTPSDVPGGFPVTPAAELDKPIGVNPLPAADGAVNPVKLAPGEKVPDSITAQNTNEHVKLDKASYEKSDTLAGVSMDIPPVSKTDIPEVGIMPVAGSNDATINTVGVGSTTTALAGQVPLEPKVPQVVKESQKEAGQAPEASAIPAEVKDKAKVEDELMEKVPEAPSTSEGTAGFGTEKTENASTIAATAATAGGAAVAALIAARDTIVGKATPAVNQASTVAADTANKNLPDSVKEKLPVAAQEAIAGQNKEEKREEVSPEVPAEVKESIAEAGKDPEAATNTAAVEEKKAVESELLREVKKVPAEGETKGEEVKPDTKPENPKAGTPANGTDTKPTPATPATPVAPSTASTSKVAGSTSTADTKKKNRLSSVFSKIKHKISDKK